MVATDSAAVSLRADFRVHIIPLPPALRFEIAFERVGAITKLLAVPAKLTAARHRQAGWDVLVIHSLEAGTARHCRLAAASAPSSVDDYVLHVLTH